MNDTNNKMKIAIPLAEGKLAMHFGHCEQFALIDVDMKNKTIIQRQDLTPPAHEPGVIPRWVGEQGACLIFAGGMGQRAQDLFAQQHVDVMVGLPSETPEKLVESFFNGTLKAGANVCDH